MSGSGPNSRVLEILGREGFSRGKCPRSGSRGREISRRESPCRGFRGATHRTGGEGAVFARFAGTLPPRFGFSHGDGRKCAEAIRLSQLLSRCSFFSPVTAGRPTRVARAAEAEA